MQAKIKFYSMSAFTFKLLPGTYSLCRLDPHESVPKWVFLSGFYTISKSKKELSIICEKYLVPDDVQSDTGWRLLYIDGTLDLSLTGITAQFSAPLAKAGINLCVVATYDTDYLMLKTEKLEHAIEALRKADIGVEI